MFEANWLLSGTGLDPMKKGGTSNAALDPMKKLNMVDDPLLAEALQRSRAQTDDPDPDPALRLRPIKRNKSPADQVLWQWEPYVRLTIAANEMGSRVRVEGTAVKVQLADGSWQAACTLTPPGDAVLREQVALTLGKTEFRTDRTPEIVTQSGSLWPYWSAITHVSADSAPRTFELATAGLNFCSALLMSLKHAVACPRPVDVSPYVQPVIETPGHGSLPSGHASAGFFFAEMMGELLQLGGAPRVRVQLDRLALRIADNRVVAGVHFPMDTVAGYVYARAMANFFVSVCTGTAKPFAGASFDASALAGVQPPTVEGSWDDGAPRSLVAPGVATALASPVLQGLWKRAEAELDQLGLR